MIPGVIPEVIQAEISGYCDTETGECVNPDPNTAGEKPTTEETTMAEEVGDAAPVSAAIE